MLTVESEQEMRFAHPEFLHLLWIVLPLALLLLFGLQQKHKALLQFYNHVDPAHLQRHRIQAGLLLLSYILLTFAIARPQWGEKPESVAERLDVMFALDVSTSMLAEDEASLRRLTHAKEVMFSLLDALEGDRVGLLYFAEASFVVCPLTSDTATFREILEAITAETLSHSGTRIGNAIKTATERLSLNQNDTTDTEFGGQKVLILFTDGEDHGEEAIEAAKTASEAGVHIYCVGVGNAAQSVPIPLPRDTTTETTPYKRNANGQLVLTALDEARLQEISEAGSGKYYHAGTGIEQLTADLARLEKRKFRTRSDGEYQERFQLFVVGALVLLICELLHFAIWRRRLRS